MEVHEAAPVVPQPAASSCNFKKIMNTYLNDHIIQNNLQV